MSWEQSPYEILSAEPRSSIWIYVYSDSNLTYSSWVGGGIVFFLKKGRLRINHSLRIKMLITLSVAAIVATVVILPLMVYRFWEASCLDDPDGRMLNNAKGDKILDVFPENASPIVDVYVSPACEDENGVTEVGRRYQFTGSPLEVAAFYQGAAASNGWRLLGDGRRKINERPGSTEKWPSDTCYLKNFGKTIADLELSFDYWSNEVEKNPSVQTYWLEISFSQQGGNCHISVEG